MTVLDVPISAQDPDVPNKLLTFSAIRGNLKQVSVTGDIGLNYDLLFSTNLVNWEQLLRFNLSTSPYPYIDPASATAPRRFYRLRLTP